MTNIIGVKRINMFFTSKCVIENRYQPGSGVGAKSAFVRNTLNKRASSKKDGAPYLSLCKKNNS
jgi:hypothetical protein